MRIVVISDSHRRTNVIDKILAAQPEARHVFFLGDNAADIEDFEFIYPEKTFHTVSGNCDYASLLPCAGLEILDGCRILYTHGHTFDVKGGTGALLREAKLKNCRIALFGHTHISQTVYADGVYLVNPGSCSSPRSGRASYAVIDITPSGIMPIIIEL
ncbi:MAG: YfcE family phosphodiesterase [Clostridia bacterium]|nr:YfcE family phosphodiesterase [Clostridia bacterium]